MDKFVVKGARKLLSLTKTKIRLAEEAETLCTKPKPLPLVKLLSGVELKSIGDVKDFIGKIRLNFEDEDEAYKTVLELMDVVEGVKHKFEPLEYCALVDETTLGKIEERVKLGEAVNILLMSDKVGGGVNLYVGYDPLESAIHYGRVPTTLAVYLAYALKSDALSKDMKLASTKIILGHNTLILNAIYHAIKYYGAKGL